MMVPAMAAVDEKTIKITGLAEGDNVKYYKVIEWTDSGWAFVSPFDTLTDDQKKQITGYKGPDPDDPTKQKVVEGIINDTLAAAMAGKVTSSTATIGEDTLAAGVTEWSKSNVAPGLYMALITAAAPKVGKDMVVYNPVFMAVQADNTGSEVGLPKNYDQNGTAKKSTVTLDKTTHSAGDTEWVKATTEDVGDIIDYKIETTIPAYLDSWTNPLFTVSDTLSSGLTFAVKEGEGDAALTDITVSGETAGEMQAGTQYTVTEKTASTFTIKFSDTYLKGRVAAEKVTITYKAKITADAKNVNPETNTATLTYDRNPNDSNDHGTKEDKTKHYTFDIDAGLNGNDSYTTSEIVKVAVDEAGNPITAEKTYSNTSKHHPLAGAEFEIFTDEGCTTHYTNSTITETTKFTSSDMGLLNIKGLDEGTYYLKETKAAPGGYMLLTEKLKFVIEAVYDDVAATDTCNAYKVLKSYTVKTYTSKDEYQTAIESSYTMDNGTVEKVGTPTDRSREVENTKGLSLPSTGGMGTTLLYVGGSILVILAAILLITKRRMSADE